MSLVPPGAHGGDGPRLAAALGVAVDEVLDLSMSLNPLAPELTEVLLSVLPSHTRYPDDRAATAALAGAIGVEDDRVVLTNGGAEAIALVAAETGTGWVDEPDFSLYRRHLAGVAPGAPRWRSNPHNPTGRLAGADEVAAVWDEAFYPLATGEWTRGDPHAIVVGSLTKLFVCPGLRIGYVLAPDPEVAAAVRRHRPAWSLSSLAAEALPAMLGQARLRAWADGVAELRGTLVSVLRRAGFDPCRSDANYLWVPGAPGLRDRLQRHAIAVRSGASFGDGDAVRIAVPDEAGIARVARALGVG